MMFNLVGEDVMSPVNVNSFLQQVKQTGTNLSLSN